MVDANTLISGIVFHENEHKLLLSGKAKDVELMTPEDAVDEVKKVIKIKFPEYVELIDIFIEVANIKIIEREIYQEDINKYEIVRDKKDRYLLAAAQGLCDIIVSGDKDLLTLKEYKGIKIVKTREVLDMLKNFTKIKNQKNEPP